MNDHKIDFIICSNDNRMFAETCMYIQNLYIPQGYEINVLEIREAASIFAGYNEGMNASDARYKVYMHHDTRIIDRNFLYVMLDAFRDPKVGMMGVIGRTVLAEQPWNWDTGAIVETTVNSTHGHILSEEGGLVKQIDGLLMATQYDLLWREDWFGGWHIYDRSQCCEFLRAGYRIMVPTQRKALCLHDCGTLDLTGYGSAHKEFLIHYGDMVEQSV